MSRSVSRASSRVTSNSNRGGPACPSNPEHGRLLDAPGADHGWYCPHVDHDGRSERNPLGYLARTSPYFRTDEVRW